MRVVLVCADEGVEMGNEDGVEEYVENMKLNMESLNGVKVSFRKAEPAAKDEGVCIG